MRVPTKDDQLQLTFTWRAKFIISFKQLMQEAKRQVKEVRVLSDDLSKFRNISITEAVKFLFQKYRSFKNQFVATGNYNAMPDFVYFQD